MKSLVSIIIPVKNSARYLEECLASIKKQSYKNIEVLIIDSGSNDNTKEICSKFKVNLINYRKKVQKGIFDAPFKRNYGVSKSNGEFVYIIDADMILSANVVFDCVKRCEEGISAIIVPEESFGFGIWAEAKKLERRCYIGDDNVEAPRFFVKKAWVQVGGLDESVGGGGDDWDLFQKMKEGQYKTGRIKSVVYHNEGTLSLRSLFWKRFRYGRQTLNYLKKRPRQGTKSYFPIRWSYIKNWKLFFQRPMISIAFLIMRFVEYLGGFCGITYSIIKK